MLAVSSHLPEIYRRRLVHHRVPNTMAALFSEVANLLEHLHSSPAQPEELQDDSLRLKSQLLELVEAIGPELDRSLSREATLSALTGGMFAGALDGALLYAHRRLVTQPTLQPASAALERPSRVLWGNLARVLEAVQNSWGEETHVDDLQLFSGAGKLENRNSLEEGEAMEAQTRADRLEFQTFLLASFKGGYAMGVVDAAVMYIGGERPDAVVSE